MAATNVQAFSGDVEISSNLAVNTNDLFVDTVTGRVGIGTTNPGTAKLRIDLDTITSDSQHLIMRANYENANNGYLEFLETNHTPADNTWLGWGTRIQKVVDTTRQGYIEFNPVGDGYDIAFGNDGGGGSGEIMRVDGVGGNVGIGTTNPQNSLHLFKASVDQTSGLFIEKQNGASGTAQITFGVNDSNENVGVAKAGIFFQRTTANGLGSLKLAVDANSDANDVGVSDSLITLKNNYYMGFGLNLDPEQIFHFVRETEDDHLYVKFGKARTNITSQQYWKPYMYASANSTNTQYAGTTYYSNGFFIGVDQMSAGWGSTYYGGNVDIRAGNVYSPGNNGTASSTNYYGGDIILQGGTTRTGGASGQTSRTYGGSIIFKTQSTDTYANTDANVYERMRVDGPTGNVGIGTNAPAATLQVGGGINLGSGSQYLFRPRYSYYQSFSGTSGFSYHQLDVNNTWTLNVNGYDKMYVRPDSGVLIDNFTGQHRSFVENVWTDNIDDHIGLIVSANKNTYTSASFAVYKGNRAIQINESLPDVRLSNVAYDKSCFGVISSGEDPDSREDTYGTITIPIPKEKGDTRIFINSLGEGAIWVTNINGPLESGDYITTSNVAGYGQKQDSEFLANYTVAKITMDCDFNPVTQPIQIIKKEMGDVNYWVKKTYINVSEETYSNLNDDKRRTITETYYSNGEDEIMPETYNTLEAELQSDYTELTRNVYQQIDKSETTEEEIEEGYELEVRQELTNVLDERGEFMWEDDPSGATEKAYEIRYLDANGNITDEANHVYKAAFVGCTYHCG